MPFKNRNTQTEKYQKLAMNVGKNMTINNNNPKNIMLLSNAISKTKLQCKKSLMN